ncbi:hypothetical protein OFN71_30540, partial [Escherichia coli]|nr:hypothetical protein [Escherichia coli]
TLHCSVSLARDVTWSVLSGGFLGWSLWLSSFRTLLACSIPVDVYPAIAEVVPFGGSDFRNRWANHIIN